MPNISKTPFVSLLLSFILIYLAADADEMVSRTNIDSPPPETGIGGAPPPPPQPIDCDGRCEERCKLSSRQRLCKRACGTCCDRCGCVPPGTAGNYDTCPCYANMITHGGRRKCP
ncbi:gibberellin-regulated protein 11 isoform X2 [Ziziphus jujuba]|uniref:Gibberellin-regulated protein 11 isoform X2 n=1 Tax=Ziziphus jujuba TaxID=326968 RepID=A0A6P4AUP2_ZIZJJ|nr:gibberellin-regulated protein 11 isoform X2 [Ziziphus jujuba]